MWIGQQLTLKQPGAISAFNAITFKETTLELKGCK